jgi:hypothetical protein
MSDYYLVGLIPNTDKANPIGLFPMNLIEACRSHQWQVRGGFDPSILAIAMRTGKKEFTNYVTNEVYKAHNGKGLGWYKESAWEEFINNWGK